jgi:hypothetical protein
MKKLITIVAGVLLVGFSALAQGTILLQNFGTGFTTSQVRDVNNVLIAKDAPITVELLAGTAANSLTPFTTAITTTHWAGAGYFGLGEPTPGSQRVLPGFLPGTFPFFQIRAWNNTGGITTWAAALAAGTAFVPGPVFQLVAGGGINGLGDPNAQPTPILAGGLFGMPTGFQLVPVPEPSTIVLGVFGAAALLLRRRK